MPISLSVRGFFTTNGMLELQAAVQDWLQKQVDTNISLVLSEAIVLQRDTAVRRSWTVEGMHSEDELTWTAIKDLAACLHRKLDTEVKVSYGDVKTKTLPKKEPVATPAQS